jgi:hypothetical protein
MANEMADVVPLSKLSEESMCSLVVGNMRSGDYDRAVRFYRSFTSKKSLQDQRTCTAVINLFLRM